MRGKSEEKFFCVGKVFLREKRKENVFEMKTIYGDFFFLLWFYSEGL